MVTHVDPHLDEIETIRRFQRGHGEKQLPGSTVAAMNVRFTEGMWVVSSDTYFDSIRMLPIGCVPGTRFNDKSRDGKRIPGHCTCTIVSSHLGLNDPILKRIAEEVLRCDSEPGVKSTELAELVKMGHRRVSNNASVLKWAIALLDAVNVQLAFAYVPAPGNHSLMTIFGQFVNEDRFPDDQARPRLCELVKGSMDRKDRITELSFIADCLIRANHPDTLDLVGFALDHLYNDIIEYRNAIKECRKSHDRITVEMFRADQNRVIDLRVLFVKSDHPSIIRASKHQDAGAAGLLIKRNSAGQVGVFADKNRQGLHIDDLVAMIRWTELPKDQLDRPLVGGAMGIPADLEPAKLWDWLKSDGALEQVPHWYYARGAGHFMNGSLTHPNEPATEIASQFFIDMTHCAFVPEKVREWKRRRGIPLDGGCPPKPKHNQPQRPEDSAAHQTAVRILEEVEANSSPAGK